MTSKPSPWYFRKWHQSYWTNKESPKYHPVVVLEFNESAYINHHLFLKHIKLYLYSALKDWSSLFPLNLYLLHKTLAVLDVLRYNKIKPILIPTGCTGLLQPLDVFVNKQLKAKIRDLIDEAILDCENISEVEMWTMWDKRILTTCWVGDTWYQFCIEQQDSVKKVFRKVGLSLSIDGSANQELDIKGFYGIDIGDWKWMDERDTASMLADVISEHDKCSLNARADCKSRNLPI